VSDAGACPGMRSSSSLLPTKLRVFSSYHDLEMTPSSQADATFEELWAVFLGWRAAILDWPLSPRAVFQEIAPVEDLESLQFLTDERWRVIDHLLAKPDTALRDAFSAPYRQFIDALHDGHTHAEWWEGQITPWLRTFLSYAVDTVPPNYRRCQM